MTTEHGERNWLSSVGGRDLHDIHHALRMLLKHPSMVSDESLLLTDLADAFWNEHTRRCTDLAPRIGKAS